MLHWNKFILERKKILWEHLEWKWALNIADNTKHFQGLNAYNVII